ncbi:stAR-related lipid transfer protein 4 isoform X4 [Pyrgilauda ruficollis]|uniref:stAR-related lipid transfer protein 4 isoform X4 n=1 Tax=Pyrgilauda ruficollis TaxID=221976 RepID=UPI001B879B73|nr:stAR-related lipid transfer protein 4 isoform X4 [Pyrgilauda ruficollis]
MHLRAGGKQMDPLPNPAPLASKLRNTLVRYHSIGDGEWRVAKKTKDATVWRKPSEEFSGYLYKAQGVVEDVTNRIVDHIRPGPYRLDWDSLMTSMDIMETFEANCCVMRYTTAGQLWNIIAPREFVDFSYTTSYEDGLLTCERKRCCWQRSFLVLRSRTWQIYLWKIINSTRTASFNQSS